MCLFALCLAVHGCTTVTGGAAELSWKLRPASGSPDSYVDCDGSGNLSASGQLLKDTGLLTAIRLHWQVGDVADHEDFNCSTGHGVTGFVLPKGEAYLSIAPICSGVEAATSTYTAAAPEQRTVIVGNTVSLGALALVLEVSNCIDPMPTGTEQLCICQF